MLVLLVLLLLDGTLASVVSDVRTLKLFFNYGVLLSCLFLKRRCYDECVKSYAELTMMAGTALMPSLLEAWRFITDCPGFFRADMELFFDEKLNIVCFSVYGFGVLHE